MPSSYKPIFEKLEAQKVIKLIKDKFEKLLSEKLNLVRVSAPIIVPSDTGVNDLLNGYERPVEFDVKETKRKLQIVQSLAKWKRIALKKYGFDINEGLYTDMNAIRRDEDTDNIHSIYVDQWDWERIISKEERNVDYLKKIVKDLFEVFKMTEDVLIENYPDKKLNKTLPNDIFFITSQELEDMYPDKMPAEREQLIGKEKKAVFIIGIGDKLKSGVVHDKRSPDYDDWKLDGDLLIYDKAIDKTIEISSMGIRVDETSLKEQLEKAKCMDRLEYPYHQKILKKELPYTIGGGIGQSRILMLILEKEHIAEVQASSWEEKTELELKDMKIL